MQDAFSGLLKMAKHRPAVCGTWAGEKTMQADFHRTTLLSCSVLKHHKMKSVQEKRCLFCAYFKEHMENTSVVLHFLVEHMARNQICDYVILLKL